MPKQTVTEEKLTVSWDEMNTRQVDKRLRQQEALERNRRYAQIKELPEGSAPASTSIWFNTIFYMTFFGLLGGLAAWGCSEVLHFRPSTRMEATELMTTVKEVNRAVATGRLTEGEAQVALSELARAGRDNPYFAVFSSSKFTQSEKDARMEKIQARDAWKEFITNVMAFGIAGMIIAMCLGMAESVVDRNVPAMIINGSIGATLGLLGGVVVALFVDRLYHAMGGLDGTMTSGRQIVARSVTWGVLGLTLTLAPGIVMRNFKKLAIGAAGGLIGGIIGGALYDPIAIWIQNPHISRLISMVMIGAVAGLGSGLIENAAKTGWVRVVQGLIAGKQFILYRNPTYIGSSPDNQIYLFKDVQVGRRHAAIHLVPGGFEIEDLPLGGETLLNGRAVERSRLKNGDRVQIGATCFLFQEKQPAS